MSTPLAMPPQPFSTVFVPANASLALPIPAGMRNAGMGNPSHIIELPTGVVQVIITWKGVDPLSIRHYTGTSSNWETVATIPASTTVKDRSTGVMTLASDKRQGLMVTHGVGGSSWNATTLSKGYVAGLQVIPMGTNADITGGGSLLRTDTSVGTRVFLGNTMIHGDTGWRALAKWGEDKVVSGSMPTGLSADRIGGVFIRKISLTRVQLRIQGGRATSTEVKVSLPAGYSADASTWATYPTTVGGPVTTHPPRATTFRAGSGHATIENVVVGETLGSFQYGTFLEWETDPRWPPSLPGLPI